MFRLLHLACLLWLLIPFNLCGQSIALKLRNGDRLTGKILSETTNQVNLSTTWAKEISVPLTEILSREIIPITQNVAINTILSTTNNSTSTNSIAATNAIAATNVVSSTNASATNTLAKTPPVVVPTKPPVKPKKPSSWHGDAQVGVDVGISATRRQLYYGRFKITFAPVHEGPPGTNSRVIERFRNTFDYNAAYGTTDGLLSANRMDGSSKTDFDLGAKKRFFVYNLIGGGYDEIRKIDARYEFGPGIGYHVFTRTNFVLNTEVGLNYQVQYLATGATTERFYYRFAEDLTWKISKTLTFDEKLEFFPAFNLQEYRLRFESNLKYFLLENLTFNLTVLDIFDTQPAANVGENDLQIRSSIGLKF
ncbi:MAG: DUF481 domain-containing protein [Verrucomicrobiota bacterium]